MPNKWIHINTEVGDPWILPIWGAVNDAESSGKASPISKEVKSQLGLSISTRLDMLPRIVHRINEEVNEVYKTTKTHNKEHIFTELREGYAFDIEENLKFNLLIDIDSLLFELNSICELMTSLFFVLYTHIGKIIKKKKVGLIIKKMIEGDGKSSDWFNELDNQRNFFMHEGAPYFAVDISEGPGKYDLLIMRENIKFFNDHSKFVKLSEINSIVEGFSIAKPIIQKHLIELYKGKP
jgi:hypothetical protein